MTRVGEVESRLRQVVQEGAQAFWICPLVSDSELIDLKAAETRAADGDMDITLDVSAELHVRITTFSASVSLVDV